VHTDVVARDAEEHGTEQELAAKFGGSPDLLPVQHDPTILLIRGGPSGESDELKYKAVMETLKEGLSSLKALDGRPLVQQGRFNLLDSRIAGTRKARLANLDDKDASLLARLKRGDILIWVLEGDAPCDMHRKLKERGVYVILYEMEGARAHCICGRVDVNEIWHYSHYNINLCKESGHAPILRYVPPGYTEYLDTSNVSALFKAPTTKVGVIAAWTPTLDCSEILNGVRRGGGKTPDELRKFIGEYMVQLTVNGHCSITDTENGMETAFDALQASPILSLGALLVSPHCYSDDEREFTGLVDFLDVREMTMYATNFASMEILERQRLSDQRKQRFKETFSSEAVLRRAGVDRLLTSSSQGSFLHHRCLRLARQTITRGERDEDIHPWACLKLLMEDARIALTHTDASNSMERQWADVKITSGVVFGTMFCAWFGLILIKAHCTDDSSLAHARECLWRHNADGPSSSRNAAAIATFFLFGSTLTTFNKWLFLEDGGNLPAVLELVALHQLLAALLTQVIRISPWGAALMPATAHDPLAGLTCRKVYELFVPPATFLMASLVFGNKAFLYLPVHVIQMTLCASPLIVYCMATLTGIEAPSLLKAIVLLCSATAALGVAFLGERDSLRSSVPGMLFQFCALGATCSRVVAMKTLARIEYLDSLSTLSLLSPICFLLLIIVLYASGASHVSTSTFLSLKWELAGNGLIAMVVNYSVIALGKLVTPTEYALLVALKAIAMALGSFAIAIRAIAPLQAAAFVTCSMTSALLLPLLGKYWGATSPRRGTIPWSLVWGSESKPSMWNSSINFVRHEIKRRVSNFGVQT
jgi:hypothetical protein